MAQRPALILLAFGEQHDALAGRLVLMGFRALKAHGPGAVQPQFDRDDGPVRGLVLPSEPSGLSLSELTSGLHGVFQGDSGVPMMVTGPRPGAGAMDALRMLGVRHCLWEPCNDSELRFILNRMVYDSESSRRGDVRVPTDMMVRIQSAAGEKPALVYNLSVGGAYLETHRPTNVGGHVSISLPLPGGAVEVAAVVVAANVPGNLQRPNLPRGMGVRFERVGDEERAAIHKYVQDRADAYEL